ncbi:hypothetical protein LCGC14_2723470 [marine sediment metagenome]|uniref:Uncharacterized protein n=1 Tax=marine sediment metagenome TaxID=412755 RepID=A0A0F8ZWW9_9ZZZZ
MTLKQQIVKKKLLKELGVLRRKREHLLDQIEGLKEYKKILRTSPKKKIATQSKDPDTSQAISILS